MVGKTRFDRVIPNRAGPKAMRISLTGARSRSAGTVRKRRREVAWGRKARRGNLYSFFMPDRDAHVATSLLLSMTQGVDVSKRQEVPASPASFRTEQGRRPCELTDRSPQSAVRLVRKKRREVTPATGYASTSRIEDLESSPTGVHGRHVSEGTGTTKGGSTRSRFLLTVPAP